jgi:hypothetical protein
MGSATVVTVTGSRVPHHFLDNQRSVKEFTLLSQIRPLRSDDIDQALGGGIEKAGGNDCLLCVSNSVPAHDIYSKLRDRNGHLCCNGQDCGPVEATVLPNVITTCQRAMNLFPPT